MELSLLYSSPLCFGRAVRQEESRLCMHILVVLLSFAGLWMVFVHRRVCFFAMLQGFFWFLWPIFPLENLVEERERDRHGCKLKKRLEREKFKSE